MTLTLSEREPIPDNLKLLYEVCLTRNRSLIELPSSVLAMFKAMLSESEVNADEFLNDSARLFSADTLTQVIVNGAVFHSGGEDTLIYAQLLEQLKMEEIVGNSMLQEQFINQGVYINLDDFKDVHQYVTDGLKTLYEMGYLGCIVDPHGYNAITMIETDNPVELYYVIGES